MKRPLSLPPPHFHFLTVDLNPVFFGLLPLLLSLSGCPFSHPKTRESVSYLKTYSSGPRSPISAAFPSLPSVVEQSFEQGVQLFLLPAANSDPVPVPLWSPCLFLNAMAKRPSFPPLVLSSIFLFVRPVQTPRSMSTLRALREVHSVHIDFFPFPLLLSLLGLFSCTLS